MPGIDAENDLAGEPLAHAFKPAWLLECLRPHYHAGHAPLQRLGNVLFGAESAPKLTRHAGLLDDPAHTIAVDRPALFGAVQIYQVQVGGSFVNPALSHGGGIIAENRFLGIIALPQPHTQAGPQVDSRENLHRYQSSVTSPWS